MAVTANRQQNLLIAAGATGGIVLYAIICELTGVMARCPFKWLTGLQCPGCGSQRALRALLEGNFMEAWSYNLLLPPLVIYLGMLWLLPLFKSTVATKIYAIVTSPGAIFLLLAVVILWGVLRNIFNI